jgi:hypothetical protein
MISALLFILMAATITAGSYLHGKDAVSKGILIAVVALVGAGESARENRAAVEIAVGLFGGLCCASVLWLLCNVFI